MAGYLSISGIVKVDPSRINVNAGVLEGITALGVPAQFLLKQPALVEVVPDGNGNGTFLRYSGQVKEYAGAKDGKEDNYAKLKKGHLEARGDDLQDAEAMMRSIFAFELARYCAAKEMSPHAEKIAPMGRELSDLLK